LDDAGQDGRLDETALYPEKEISKTQQEKLRKLRKKAKVVTEYVDIIREDFWRQRPWILSSHPGQLPLEIQ
jgi:tRNA(His) guanylyltransferase